MASGIILLRIQAHHDPVGHSSASQLCKYVLWIARSCEDRSPRSVSRSNRKAHICVDTPQSQFHQDGGVCHGVSGPRIDERFANFGLSTRKV